MLPIKVKSVTNVKRTLFISAVLAFGAFCISTVAQVSGGTSSQTELPSTNLDFSLDVTSGDAPLEVNVAVTERPEGEGWSYSWIFNDGPIVEGESATHIYDEPAENSIILLAERNGEVRTATRIVMLRAAFLKSSKFLLRGIKRFSLTLSRHSALLESRISIQLQQFLLIHPSSTVRRLLLTSMIAIRKLLLMTLSSPVSRNITRSSPKKTFALRFTTPGFPCSMCQTRTFLSFIRALTKKGAS